MRSSGIAVIAAIFCFVAQAPAQDATPPATGTPVDINAIKPGETYRWGSGNYLENKGDCRFDIGGRTWGPMNFRAPTGRGVHRINSRQSYTADCISGNIKLTLIDN